MDIVIIDKDQASRAAIKHVLAAYGLAEQCHLVSKKPEGMTEETAYICIGAVPGEVDIKESDQFLAPVRIGALLERVRRYAAMGRAISTEPLAIGQYMLDPPNNLLTDKKGKTIRLTDKETHMLGVLAAHKGAAVDRRMLLDEVWGYAENVETHTLETHIYRLRQKIEQDPAKPAFLITEDQGYRLKV